MCTGRRKHRWVLLVVALVVAGSLMGSYQVTESFIGPLETSGTHSSLSGSQQQQPIEFGAAFSIGINENKRLLTDDYGRIWGSHNDCDPCAENCIAKMSSQPHAEKDVQVWGPLALQKLLDSNFRIWKEAGFNADHLVSMNSCSYKSRMRWNPHGLWLHVSGKNVTTLRMMVDGYLRTKHIRQAIIDAVAASDGVFPPVSVYVSVTDIPCNTQLPNLTFFGKRGVRGLVIPDDRFYKGVQSMSWEKSRSYFLNRSRQTPFAQRQNNLYFRGSPTHLDRQQIQSKLNETIPNFLDMKLAVMERFRSEQVPMEEIAQHRFALAIRGKTASSRDKYLNLLGSTITWVTEDEPWFQFPHVLWQPYVNFVPMRVDSCNCTARQLTDARNLAAVEEIARRGQMVGEFLSRSVVDGYLVDALRKYASMQTYKVPEDPVDFLSQIRHLVKKKYKWALLMPDDRNPVKFYFNQWLSRRMKQIQSCRTNNTYGGNKTLPLNSPHRCWYM